MEIVCHHFFYSDKDQILVATDTLGVSNGGKHMVAIALKIISIMSANSEQLT